MTDLFERAGQLRRIEMPDADVCYLSDFDFGEPLDDLLNRLIHSTRWRSEKIVVWGRSHVQPRLISWYGDKGKSYSYSGVDLEPLPWTQSLLALKARTEAVAGTSFNSVLLNYYRDNNDSMGLHSDSERELGDKPIIASLSLGDRRTLIFKHKTRIDLPTVKIPLESGSLLLMKGDTQTYWKHGINKESRPCGPRINLTFRTIIT
jgi:alkylated DNA repair dioxygenase AlkB